jgi:hypothetical protein
MGRVIAIGPGGKAQAPVRDDRCREVIQYVLEHGLLGQDLLSPVCTTMARAEDLRRALNRSASYFCSCGETFCTRKHKNYPPDNGCPGDGQRISCRADVVRWTDPADGIAKLRVQFRLRDKREGIASVIERYGPDPNNWPYYSRRRQRQGKGNT